MSLTDLPSLDQIAADPAQAADLPAAQAMALLVKVAALQPLLLARCAAAASAGGGAERTGPVVAPGPADEAVPSEGPLLTAAEAARRLGLREWRVYELARRGTLPLVRIGKTVRFRPGDLAAWIARHRE